MRKILLLIAITLSINSCSKIITYSSRRYIVSSSSNYERRNIVWNELLNQPEEEYYAYIYSETCGYCRKLEPDIIRYSENHLIYLILYEETIPVRTERTDLTDTEDVNSLYILGTPTLFQISNKKVKNCYIGFYEIQEHIKEVSYLIE